MAADVVVYPDAEQLIANWLAGELGQAVGTRVPNPRPAQFIRVLRTGGVELTPVTDAALLTVECWDRTEVAAATTAALARALLRSLPRRGIVVAGTAVQGARDVSGPQNLPDPRVPDMARYSFTIELHLRGAAAA